MAYLKYGGAVSDFRLVPSASLSDGQLKKWTGVLNGRVIYIKSNSEDYQGVSGFECRTECLASELAILLGMKYVCKYYLDYLWYDRKWLEVCYSFDFIEFGQYKSFNRLVPRAAELVGKEKYELVTDFYKSVKRYIDSILLFDAIICNNDRHLRNFGILIKNNKISVPLFDNGSSMFSNKNCTFITHMLRTYLDYLPCKPFYSTYDKQVGLLNLENITLRPIEKVTLYRLVNKYFEGDRARLIGKLLVYRLRRYGLLCE